MDGALTFTHVCVDSNQTVLEHHRFIYMYLCSCDFCKEGGGYDDNRSKQTWNCLTQMAGKGPGRLMQPQFTSSMVGYAPATLSSLHNVRTYVRHVRDEFYEASLLSLCNIEEVREAWVYIHGHILWQQVSFSFPSFIIIFMQACNFIVYISTAHMYYIEQNY